MSGNTTRFNTPKFLSMAEFLYRLKQSLFDDYIRREIEKLPILVNFA